MKLEALTDTQRTLLIPLWGRARAVREGSSLLDDPLSAEIADRLAPDLQWARRNRWGDTVHAVRARVMDDLIRSFLRSHPHATVVNLGAGLDTAFYRLDNGLLDWIDVDLPEVIALRRELLPEAQRVRSFPGSFLDPAWLEMLGRERKDVFIQAAGLFIYFREQEVREFVDRLARTLPGGELAFDYQSKVSRLFGNGGLRSAGMGGARLQWGMNGARGLSAWSERAEVAEAFPLFDRIDPGALGSRATLWAARMMDLVRAVMVAHLRFRSVPRGGAPPSPRDS